MAHCEDSLPSDGSGPLAPVADSSDGKQQRNTDPYREKMISEHARTDQS